MLSLSQFSKKELQEMSLIEIAFELLKEKKEAINFNDMMDEIASQLELTEGQVKAKIAQFYTDLNIDGRFLGIGDNRWGLRVWYPIDQVEEDVVTEIKPKKKKSKKAEIDESDDDFDELDEEDIDYDDLDDLDDDDEDDDDLLDEELDEDLKDEDFELDEEDEELDEDLELDEDEEDL